MSVTKSFSSSWGTCWCGTVKRPDPGRPLAGREGRVDVYRLPVLSRATLGLHRIGQRLQIARDRADTGLRLIRAIEPLCAMGIEIQRPGLRVRVIDVGRGRGGGIAIAVAEEHQVGEAERLAVRPRAAHHRLAISCRSSCTDRQAT